jgi:transposase InsO family protein
MSSVKKLVAKKKFNFNKIKVNSIKRELLLKEILKLKNINYVIPEKEYCGDITTNTKFYNKVARGCLKAIYELRSVNTKKVLNIPKIKLPPFITQPAFETLWEIAELKPQKNFTKGFTALGSEDPFRNSCAILFALLCEQGLQDVDLFKNTESIILHEVWVWDATYSIDMSCWVVFLMEVSSRCILGCFAITGAKKSKPKATSTCQLLHRVITELGMRPQILHSDLGTEFNNKLIRSYCKVNNIEVSFYGNDASTFGNQFIENLNGKFKNVFLKALQGEYSIEKALKDFCIGHNLSQHKGSLAPNSPIVVYYALMAETHEFPLRLALDNRVSNSALALVKGESVDYFRENSLLIPTEKEPLIVESLTYGERKIVAGLIDVQRTLEAKIDSISKTNQELVSKIDELVAFQNEVIASNLRKLEAKHRLKSRRKLTDRDCISIDLFEQGINSVQKSSKPSRLKNSLCLGMSLMYFFGIRVSNCLILDSSFFQDLLSSKKEIRIPTIKTKNYVTTTKPGEREVNRYFRIYINALLNEGASTISYDRSY